MAVRSPDPQRHRRVAAVGAALTLAIAAGAGTAGGAQAASVRDPVRDPVRAAPPTRGAGSVVAVVSSTLDVVSSTGHRLRVRVLASRSGSGSQVDLQIQSRDGSEEHDWTFQVPRKGVSLSAKGAGHVRLTSSRSAGYATVALHVVPQGRSVLSSCHHKTATRTRHVAIAGSLLLHTRSHGKHSWGNVGGARHTITFSTGSRVTWTRPAASDCPTGEFPCRSTFAWQASGGTPGATEFLTSENKGAHALIGGIRFVGLAEPAGATRADIVTVTQSTPNQLVVNGDGSATMQATFRGGTATLTSPQPAITQTQPCGAGRKKVSVEYWSADFANGTTPIRLPAQIFGAMSVDDSAAGAFYRITPQH